eukprot:5007850-Prymnesium_polylepis.1
MPYLVLASTAILGAAPPASTGLTVICWSTLAEDNAARCGTNRTRERLLMIADDCWRLIGPRRGERCAARHQSLS